MMSSRAFAQAARSSPRFAPIARTVRSYASEASAASTRPPVELYGVDGTYASALWTASAKSQSLDNTAKSLDTLNNIFKKDVKLNTVLSAPTLSTEDKNAIVKELEKQIPADKGNVVKNFLSTLADNNRLNILGSVCEKYGELVSANKGEVELVVTSAAPLDNKVLQRLESTVAKSQYVGSGRKLKVTSKVSPDIKGGLIVEIGDRTIDLSVAAKMAKMNKLLTDNL